MVILLEEGDTKGFAIAIENDVRGGMMTYSVAGAELIIIDHTEVEPSFSGKGVGKRMLYKIVEMAKEKNIKIIPLCPFAATMFKKSLDIKDVVR